MAFGIDKNKKGVKKQDIDASSIKQFNRFLSIEAAKVVAKYTKITPNQITVFVLVMAFFIAYLFSTGEMYLVLIAGILTWFNFFLDSLDGSLCRVKGIKSYGFGRWLDHATDEVGRVVVFFGITYGVYKNFGDPLVLFLGYFAITAYLIFTLHFTYFSMLPYSDRIVDKEKKGRGFLKNFYLNDPFVPGSILVFGIFNGMYWWLILFALYGWFFTTVAFLIITKKVYREAKKEAEKAKLK
jgi:phosphatidylglycerophosphate synthase